VTDAGRAYPLEEKRVRTSDVPAPCGNDNKCYRQPPLQPNRRLRRKVDQRSQTRLRFL